MTLESSERPTSVVPTSGQSVSEACDATLHLAAQISDPIERAEALADTVDQLQEIDRRLRQASLAAIDEALLEVPASTLARRLGIEEDQLDVLRRIDDAPGAPAADG